MSVEDFARKGSLGTLMFTSSGWFLVRAIAENPRTFRFASTAPFHVEMGKTKRWVSKAAAKVFLAWVKERAGRVKVEDAEKRGEVMKYRGAAARSWQEMVGRGNAARGVVEGSRSGGSDAGRRDRCAQRSFKIASVDVTDGG